jgi:predicted nucleic acid-binding Zn ribbon protein
MPDERDRVKRARDALTQAKADARARGDMPAAAPGGVPPPGAERRSGGSGGSPPRASQPPRPGRPRRDDPAPLRAAFAGLLREQGWEAQAAVGSVFGRWAEIVGAEMAAHTKPDRLDGDELVVIADSTAWATQLRWLAKDLVRTLNAELGSGTVSKVKIRGPEQPRRPGEWRVRGSRGPRDTYG